MTSRLSADVELASYGTYVHQNMFPIKSSNVTATYCTNGGVATWQSTSTLSKHWKNEFSGIPLFKHTKGIIYVPLMTKRVNDFVTSVTFSNDGKQVVVGLDTVAIVLNATTGRQQRVLSEAKNCYLVKFSWDGTRLLTVSNGLLCIWDASTFQLLKKLDVDYATISMEGTQILTASSKDADGHHQLEVLDILTGIPVRSLTLKMSSTKDYSFERMVFSVSANRFSIVFDKSVEIWDISTDYATKTFTLDGHTSTITSTAISPNQKHVATCSLDGDARVWDASTGDALMVLQHIEPVTALDFSSDGRHIVSASLHGAIHVWDATTGADLKVFNITAAEGITSVAFSSDGTRIVSASTSSVHVWSWDKSAHVKRIRDDQESELSNAQRKVIIDVAMTDDCSKIMFATRLAIQIWDVATRTELIAIPSSPMISTKMSGNGERIVSCLQDGSIVVWDATTCDKLLHLSSSTVTDRSSGSSISPFAAALVAMSRSGEKIAITREDPRRVEIWNIETGKDIEIPIDNFLCLLSFSNDGRRIVCGSAHGRLKTLFITVYNSLTGDAIRKMETEVTCETFEWEEELSTSNGREVLVCSPLLSTHPIDTLFEVWDIVSGKLLRAFKSLSYRQDNYGKFWMNCHNLSNNGKKFVAGCSDGFIRIWDVFEGIEVTVIGYSGEIITISFSRDDKQIISGSWDGSVCLWDVDSKDEKDWTLQETFWITSSQNQQHRLMWVSELLRVIQPCMTLITSRLEHGSIDFEKAMVGEDWGKCYTPRNFTPKEE